MRVLVIRPGALGDVLLTLPALQALSAAFPQASIELMGNLAVVQWLPGRSVVQTVSSFDRADLAALFQAEAVPAAALQGYLDSFDLILSYATAPEHVFARNLARVARGRVLSLDARSQDVPMHMSLRLQQPLRELGVAPDAGCPALHLTPLDQQEAARWWVEHDLEGASAVAIHPGSGSLAKNCPAERFAAVARHLQQEHGARILLVGGPADEVAVDVVRRSTGSRYSPVGPSRPGGPVLAARTGSSPRSRHSAKNAERSSGERGMEYRGANGVPLQGEQGPILLQDLPLPLLAAILSRCRVYVGNDSGVSHLAAAVGVPTVAIFGPTDPDVWAPRGPAVRIVRSETPCAPCTSQQRHACPQRSCLEAVSVPMVLDAIAALAVRK